MNPQRNIAIYVGILLGLAYHLFSIFFNYDSALEMYYNLDFVYLLMVTLSAYFVSSFLKVFSIGQHLYERIKYRGTKPNEDTSITKENSYVVGVLLSLIVSSLMFLLYPDIEILTGVLIATLTARIVKTTLTYNTGRPCRLWFPISRKIYRSEDLTPEPEIGIYWRPLELFTLGLLITFFIITFPPLQDLVLEAADFTDIVMSDFDEAVSHKIDIKD